MNECYPQWIGRGGTVAWPPRSPDLTLLDFFLWGHMKQRVYFEPVSTREKLWNIIVMVDNEIRENPRMVRKATAQVALRATACVINGGGHIEHLL